MMNKLIVKLGDTDKVEFERGLSPYSQVEKVKESIIDGKEVIYTNSPYVLESFNKFFKKDIELEVHYNNNVVELYDAFDKLSKPFEELVFDTPKKANTVKSRKKVT